MLSMTGQTVLIAVEGRLGHLTLNRPERINALDLPMIEAVRTALLGWVADPDVDLVLIDGAGERGLCAGGDIRAVYEGLKGQNVPPGLFWASEYEMNALIANYPKPVVALMDGVVFGGGLGISGHADVRIVTERSQVAMPETAIGLSPDVGALFLLARAPGELGTHAALTGARLDGPSAIHAGLADQLVDSGELGAVVAACRTGVLPPFHPAPPSAHPRWIDECYAFDTVEEILVALNSRPEGVSDVATLSQMSPTALKVTLEAIRRARAMTVEEVLDQDTRVSTHFLSHPDFAEGIRARLIDKDRNPRWRPALLADVSRAEVLAFFAPLG